MGALTTVVQIAAAMDEQTSVQRWFPNEPTLFTGAFSRLLQDKTPLGQKEVARLPQHRLPESCSCADLLGQGVPLQVLHVYTKWMEQNLLHALIGRKAAKHGRVFSEMEREEAR